MDTNVTTYRAWDEKFKPPVGGKARECVCAVVRHMAKGMAANRYPATVRAATDTVTITYLADRKKTSVTVLREDILAVLPEEAQP